MGWNGGRYSAKETWRVRAEWRLYFQPKGQLAGAGVYAAADGFYKQVNVMELGANRVPCQGPCGLGPLTQTPVLKHVLGGHPKIGYQDARTPDTRLLLDVYAGLGTRYRWTDRPDLPVGVVFESSRVCPNYHWPFPSGPKPPLVYPSGVSLGTPFNLFVGNCMCR